MIQVRTSLLKLQLW